MRVGIIQSCYIPWRGYFDFIASVDVFVFFDDVQYTRRDWRNRNKLKTSRGAEWLSVPVLFSRSVPQNVCDTQVIRETSWDHKHLRTWEANYHRAPCFNDAFDILEKIKEKNLLTISQLNIVLIRSICDYLGIKTPMILSTELNAHGRKTERLIDILKKLDATSYLSGPSADNYLDKNLFRENNIQLEYKSYDYAPYPQLFGDFIGGVTVLDLIANCGLEARKLIKTKTPDQVIISRSSSVG